MITTYITTTNERRYLNDRRLVNTVLISCHLSACKVIWFIKFVLHISGWCDDMAVG